MADLTQAFAPGNASDDLGKTDFFDFVVSPPPHCPSSGGISDDENYLHRTNCRDLNYLQDDHDLHDIHTTTVSFLKETNNNTLTALPPVSTITGSLNHHHNHHHNNNNNNNNNSNNNNNNNNHHHHHNHNHHHGVVRNHCIENTDQIPMDQSDCDYWGTDDSKEQTCNILLEDLNKYCWSTHTTTTTTTTNQNDIHNNNNNEHPVHRITTTTQTTSPTTINDRHHNTDGAIYTLTVLNNEGNSMDGLDCCKSPQAPSSDTWSLRPSIDLDAILNLESSTNDQDTNDRIPERYHIIPTPTSQYTDDSGFVESKELCRQNNNNNSVNINNNNINSNNNNLNTNNNNNNNNNTNNNNNNNTNTNNNINNNNNNNNKTTTTTTTTTSSSIKKSIISDNNNDWKLTDQNHLHDTVVVATVTNDSAESLLRSALQGKLYSGTTQIVSPSSSQSSTISLSVSSNNSLQIIEHQQQQQQQQQQTQTSQDTQQQNETMQTCTEDDFLLSQFDTDSYQPDDYEKINRITDDVVDTYCNNLEQPVTATTTTLMYTLDPTNGSLGTITLPAELGHVGTVTVVATQQDLLQTTLRNDNDNNNNNQIQITSVRTSPSITTTTSSGSSKGSSSSSSSSITTTTSSTTTTTATTNSLTKTTKKYCRRTNKNNSNNNNNNNNTSTISTTGNGNTNQHTGVNNSNSGGSPSAAQRKERSLHYCSICSKGFKDKYSVNVHIRTHTGEKPFACSLCGKSFRQKAHLAKHHQTHNAQKPNITNGNSNASNSSSIESTTNSRGSISIELAVCNQSN